MAGIPIAFGDVIHQYASIHKRVLSKRQGREPIDSLPGGGGGATTTSLSLGRPGASASLGPGDDTTSTTSQPIISRTRTSTSEPVSTPTISDDTETSTSETTTSTSETSSSSSISIITTTSTSTSTSTSFSTPEETTTSEEETTSSTSTSLEELITTTSSTPPTTRSLVTSIVTASLSLSSTASNTLASSGNQSNDNSSSPSAGTVVGIVAGALVGVVVLSGIVGYFFRTKCSNKNDNLDDFDGENPFGNMDDGGFNNNNNNTTSRSELRRDSQLLNDESDSIHQMSELGHGAPAGMGMGNYGNTTAAPIAMGAAAGIVAGGAGAYALHRGNSTGNNNNNVNNYENLPGLQRNDTMNPRPPTMIQRHYAAQAHQQQQAMPSFQPGQIVYPSNQINQSGPYPTFNNGIGAGIPIGGVFPPSSSSNQGHHQQQQQQYPSNVNNGYGGGYNQYDDNNDGYDQSQQRSGTPEHANPQQYFHQASDSFGSGIGGFNSTMSPFDDINASPSTGNRNILTQQQQQGGGYTNNYNNNNNQGYDYQNQYEQLKPLREDGRNSNNLKGSERAKRTLSVRNGGANDDIIDDTPRDSVYGGM